MPLENLLGNVYISDLNSDWPLGTDIPDAGDDHIRGVKNVLKRSFPNITGPVTLSQAQINSAVFPAGTRMLFQQTAAPTGWTKVTDHDDKALRVVSGAVVGGGTVGFSTAFGTGGATGGHVLSEAELPAHVHAKGTIAATQGAHTHGPQAAASAFAGVTATGGTGLTFGTNFRLVSMPTTQSATPSIAVSGSTAATGAGSAHVHPLAIDVSYVDTIIAEKA